MTVQEAFDQLHGEGARLTWAQARVEVAWELGIPAVQFDPRREHPEDPVVLDAIEVVRSYQEVAHIIERDPPAPLPMTQRELDEARAMLAPKRPATSNPKRSVDRTVAAQNSLWRKPSY